MTSQTPDMQAIVDRLEKLERQNRRWRLAASQAIIGLVAVFAMAQTSTSRVLNAERVTARAFDLIDSGGKLRARLGVTKGAPVLVLLDAAGEVRAGLGVMKEGPFLSLNDDAGNTRADLKVMKIGPTLSMYDAAAKERADLTVFSDKPALRLYNAAERGVVSLTSDDLGPYIELSDDNGASTVIHNEDLPILMANVDMIQERIPYYHEVSVPYLTFDRITKKFKARASVDPDSLGKQPTNQVKNILLMEALGAFGAAGSYVPNLTKENFEMEFRGASMERIRSGRKLEQGEELNAIFAIYKNGELSLR